ncbi:MAG TPA: nodulation protein NfeD, partial [Polyangiales bacterium]|nr:nodulation protein NfeD [Polyangiales bacterium]
VWGVLGQPTNVSRAEAPSTTKPVIAEIRIEGVINPIQARYVERSIERAKNEGATLLLVSIDTPGGLVTSMQQIVSALTNAGIPVVGLVEPATAQATSAGAFILLATDLAAMQPDTRVGAAHPVGAGEKLDETMSAKATNSLVSLAKSLAARRGRSESAAEAMVRDSTSYTAKEAQEKQLVEWQVASKQELLDRLDGHKLAFTDRTADLATRNGRSLPLPMSQADKLLDRLADPSLASILLSIGVLGILYELGAPGIGLGGIVGVISLLLGLSGMSVLPINLAGVLLMLAGAIAIGIELHVPTHGLVGFGGVLAMMFGGLMLFDEGSYFGALPHVDWHTQVPIVLLMGALLLLLAAQAARAQEAKPMTGPLAMVGRQAEVSSAFAAEEAEYGGTVRIEGTYWQARSHVALEAGATVEVLEVSTHPLRLRVQRSRKVRS